MRGLVPIISSLLLCISVATGIYGQQFHFGATTGLVISQVDGDQLTGFNHVGYSVGALGGYSISNYHWMLLELQYAKYGSKRGSETAGVTLPMDLQVISVLLGYSVQFGDSWDGTRQFRFLIGPRFNKVVEARSRLLDTDDFRSYLSVQATLSYAISRNFLLDFTYCHTMQNILEQPLDDFDRLIPYYLSLGVSWYLHRG